MCPKAGQAPPAIAGLVAAPSHRALVPAPARAPRRLRRGRYHASRGGACGQDLRDGRVVGGALVAPCVQHLRAIHHQQPALCSLTCRYFA